jgi:hypothetical protein
MTAITVRNVVRRTNRDDIPSSPKLNISPSFGNQGALKTWWKPLSIVPPVVIPSIETKHAMALPIMEMDFADFSCTRLAITAAIKGKATITRISSFISVASSGSSNQDY